MGRQWGDMPPHGSTQMAAGGSYLPDEALSPLSLKRRQQRRASKEAAKENDATEFKRKRAEHE